MYQKVRNYKPDQTFRNKWSLENDSKLHKVGRWTNFQALKL